MPQVCKSAEPGEQTVCVCEGGGGMLILPFVPPKLEIHTQKLWFILCQVHNSGPTSAINSWPAGQGQHQQPL